MKEYDRVILLVEKEKYANEGVHKGMDGWICDGRIINEQRLVCFDQYGALPDIAMIPIKEVDLEVVVSDMQMPVPVELIVEKEEYAKLGAHKGMRGDFFVTREEGEYWQIRFYDLKTAEPFDVWILRCDLELIDQSEKRKNIRASET